MMKKNILTIFFTVLAFILILGGIFIATYFLKPAVLFVTTEGEKYLLNGVISLKDYRIKYYDILSDKEIELDSWQCILASPIAADIIDEEKRDFFSTDSVINASFSREYRENSVFDIQFIKDENAMWISYPPNADTVFLFDSNSVLEKSISDRLEYEIKRRSFDKSISSQQITSLENYIAENQIFTLLSPSPEKAVNLLRKDNSLMVVVPMWYVKSISTFDVYGFVGEDFDTIINVLTQSDVSSFRGSGLPVNTPYSFFVK